MGTSEIVKVTTGTTPEARAKQAKLRALSKKRRLNQLNNGLLYSNYNSYTTNMAERLWNRRRIRRLRDESYLEASPRCSLKQQSINFFRYTLVPMIITMIFSTCIVLYQNTEAVSEFMKQYSSHYQAIVHNNLNYCDRNIPLTGIFKRIGDNVLNQDEALHELEQAVAKPSSFQSIALVGSSGVGKTLTMCLLLELYPWADNVQTIAWNDYQLIDEEARYQTLHCMLKNLAHCGRNLLIIDNMAASDVEYVSSINAMVLAQTGVAKSHNELDTKTLTLIYIFNLNAMLPADDYDLQLTELQRLPLTTVINYRSFGHNDLEKCVRHEAQLLGVQLEEKYVDEMVNTTDVKVTGCKTVRAKVLIYGQPKPNVKVDDFKLADLVLKVEN